MEKDFCRILVVTLNPKPCGCRVESLEAQIEGSGS